MIEFVSQNDKKHVYSSVQHFDTKIPLNIKHRMIHDNEKYIYLLVIYKDAIYRQTFFQWIKARLY